MRSGRLAGTVGAQEAEDLAGLDPQIDAVDGDDLRTPGAEGAPQTSSLNHRS